MQRFICALGWMVVILTTLAGAVFFLSLFVIAARLVPSGHEGDLGTWFSAVFTGLAFVGTIWLATSAERQRRKEMIERGKVVIPAVQAQIRLVLTELRTCVGLCHKWQSSPEMEKNSVSWSAFLDVLLDEIRKAPIVPDSYLLDLIPVSSWLVAEIHKIHGQIGGTKLILSAVKESRSGRWVSDLAGISELLSETVETVESVRSHLNEIAREQGFDFV